MTEKTARAALRAALMSFRARIRFPKIMVRAMLMAEDLIPIGKEILSQYIQKRLARKR